ncbi:DEAD/DEAH box helicase [Catenovulum adriaticum]|uniref:DEAD/DEAH box helicase n=1 Tax=Catenovulum adriaticum TaxID=2984846 RepID=A0ABY7AMB0_9ALTE|nr:DEAD/DEAH box helicase [Catenovulum sp. TS8]WAJ69446.1 DEAD/DEAH box helicase [Catenovulum sp. TS8]
MYQLRPYQQEAVDATINHFKAHSSSAVIVLPTGAGKSLVIAELAKIANGKILVLTHVKELVEQNHQKYESYGLKAGIFSAGLKRKEIQHAVTFASVQSVAPNIDAFKDKYSLLIIDECHRVANTQDNAQAEAQDKTTKNQTKNLKPENEKNTHQAKKNNNQYQKVISALQTNNPKLKILGLTATPYRLDFGWIYRYHYYGFFRSEAACPFETCIYELPLRYMIKNQFLTPPKMVNAATAHYDFSHLQATANGEYKANDINQLLTQYPRVTKAICQQIVEQATNKQGVMVFAATVQHAQEIHHYLNQFADAKQVAIVTGDTHHRDRDAIITQFKAKTIKYLINVSVLTTGFDAPHVDFIAILRPTESVSLYQQIVGRGLRLAPDKTECLVIDYAGNDFDLHYPEVGNVRPSKNTVPVSVPCPLCGFNNTFWGKTDADGDIIEHYGRRCWGVIETAETNNLDTKLADTPPTQCNFRFKFKNCPQCQTENDIAARYCHECQHALVDPDDQIKDALKLKNSMVIRCSGMQIIEHQEKLKVIYYDEDGQELSELFNLANKTQKEKFNAYFARRLALATQPTAFESNQQVIAAKNSLPYPDFVIAQQKKKYWQVVERIFDYQGNFRKANQM